MILLSMSTQHHQATFTHLCYTSKYHRINRHDAINTSWRVWIPEQTISVQNCSTLAIVCQLSVPKLKMPKDKGRHTLTAREWSEHSAPMPCLWAQWKCGQLYCKMSQVTQDFWTGSIVASASMLAESEGFPLIFYDTQCIGKSCKWKVSHLIKPAWNDPRIFKLIVLGQSQCLWVISVKPPHIRSN